MANRCPSYPGSQIWGKPALETLIITMITVDSQSVVFIWRWSCIWLRPTTNSQRTARQLVVQCRVAVLVCWPRQHYTPVLQQQLAATLTTTRRMPMTISQKPTTTTTCGTATLPSSSKLTFDNCITLVFIIIHI